MLYNVIIALINAGRTEGLREKVDVLFAAGRITEDEYTKIIVALA